MTIYYLMIKTHNITGLKYLCQTRKKDPIKYLGSGLEWTNHLNKFGKTLQTEILLQTGNKQELNDAGRYYSKLWRITTAMDDFGNRIWANAIPETGGGPGIPNPTDLINQKRSEKLKGRVFPHMKESPSASTRLKMSIAQRGVPKGPMSEEQKEAIRATKAATKTYLTCEHCSKTVYKPNYFQHHGDRCRNPATPTTTP